MLAAWSQYVRNQKTHNIYSISSSMLRLSAYVILCFLIAFEPWCIEFTYSCCLVLFLLSNLINAAPHTHSVRVFCFSGLIICRLPCFLHLQNKWVVTLERSTRIQSTFLSYYQSLYNTKRCDVHNNQIYAYNYYTDWQNYWFWKHETCNRVLRHWLVRISRWFFGTTACGFYEEDMLHSSYIWKQSPGVVACYMRKPLQIIWRLCTNASNEGQELTWI